MKRSILPILTVFIFGSFIPSPAYCQDSTNGRDLKVVFIRHAEKPLKGDNLTCQGLNRALQLPALLFSKFGVPNYVYVPSLGLGQSTKHSRMFETVEPLAVKYNLTINSKYEEKDSAGIAADIKCKKGMVLVVWEHRSIAPILGALGVNNPDLIWNDDDYDSIWMITFYNGAAVLTRDKEGLTPSANCSY